VGDHATNIAEDVIFIVEARDVRHGSAGLISTPHEAIDSGAMVERRRTDGSPPV